MANDTKYLKKAKQASQSGYTKNRATAKIQRPEKLNNLGIKRKKRS